MCVRACVIGHLPKQHVAKVAGSDPFKGVHMKVMEVAVGILGMNVGSRHNTQVMINTKS